MQILRIDTETLLLTLCLSNLILAGILYVFHNRESVSGGVWWWVAGISLLGLHFFFKFLQYGFISHTLLIISANIVLVACSIVIFYGLRDFFTPLKISKSTFGISIFFVIVIIGLSILVSNSLPTSLASLSTAVISVLSARILFTNKKPGFKKITKYLSFVFLVYSVIYFVQSIFFFPPLFSLFDQLRPTLEIIAIFISLPISLLWTFGFLFLVNKRQIKNSSETEHIFNQTINTIPDAVLITRLKDGLIIKVNQGFTKLSGYSAEDVKTNSTLDVNLWCNPDERQKFVILLTKTGSVENLEFHFRKKNGKELIGLVSAQITHLDGETHILSIVRDITSRKKMEEKLRENEEKYRFLAEYSGDVIWHINRSYRIDFISTADETIRGFKREEVIGQPIWNIFKPEGIKLVREKIEHHRQVEQVGNNMNVTRFEIEQRTRDGNWIWTDITAAPHYNKYGKLVGYHGISRDISERKRLLEELNRYATIDELCQIPNRRHFMTLAEKELKRSKRYHHKLSICLIDFDNLKAINDSHGHLAGDRALSMFAKMVQTMIRDMDIIGRFGGDEFLILLPETDQEQAYKVIDRIRGVISTSPIHFKGESYKISISAGITCIKEWTVTLDDLLNRADEALYKAKELGGNNIAIHDKNQAIISTQINL